jgi:hypothetical protein
MVPNSVWSFVAQMAHWLCGAFVVLASVVLWGDHAKWVATGIIVILAAFKEFYIDQNFETPDERGSNLLDFTFYLVGVCVAHVIIYFGHVSP